MSFNTSNNQNFFLFLSILLLLKLFSGLQLSFNNNVNSKFAVISGPIGPKSAFLKFNLQHVDFYVSINSIVFTNISFSNLSYLFFSVLFLKTVNARATYFLNL